jgi:hypothetical protein
MTGIGNVELETQGFLSTELHGKSYARTEWLSW